MSVCALVMKNPAMKKLFWFFFLACLLSIIAIIPYMLTLQAEVIENIPIPLSVWLPLQVIQNTVIFAVFIRVGMRLSGQVGLEAPILESWLSHEKTEINVRTTLTRAFLLGLLAGLLIVACDVLFYLLVGGIDILKAYPGQPTPPLWQVVLALPYGAIAEEVGMRLFVMTVFVWTFHKIRPSKEGGPTSVGVWLAIGAAAVLFGFSHLPGIMFFIELTAFGVFRIVFLNAVGGTIFGWLYWKRGFESAMVAHLAMDIVLHIVLLPLV